MEEIYRPLRAATPAPPDNPVSQKGKESKDAI